MVNKTHVEFSTEGTLTYLSAHLEARLVHYPQLITHRDTHLPSQISRFTAGFHHFNTTMAGMCVTNVHVTKIQNHLIIL